MAEHEIVSEFAITSEARSFSFWLLVITTGIGGIFALFLYQNVELPWYSAMFLAYMFQFAIIIWAIDRYLVQDRISGFVRRHTKEKIAEVVKMERLYETREVLRRHYNRDQRFWYLLDFFDFLLSPSDMILFKILKYVLLICSGVILLPYFFVFNSPETYLTVLAESSGNTVTGHRSYLFSIYFIGFILFGISLIAWICIWLLYCEGLFD